MQASIRILYVDDESGLLEIGKLFLERDGACTVDTFTSAREALEQLETKRYDAIISDYQMPEINGITFLKKLKSAGDATPFIIFTGRGREEIVIEALNEGADFYLQKGGEPKSQFAELSNKVRYAIMRRQAEDALHESEKRFRELSDLHPQVVYESDTKGNLTYANHIAFERFGYTEDEFRQGLNVMQMLAPSDRERGAGVFRQIAEGRGKMGPAEEYLAIRKDGTTFPISIYSTPVVASNRITGIRGIIVDMTDRKRVEEALAKSGERLRRAERVAGLGHWEFDLTTRDVHASDGARSLYGMHGEQWNIDDVQQIPLPEYRQQLDHALRDLIEKDQPYDVEFKIQRHTDGKILSIHSIAEYDPAARVVFGVIQDITEKKQQDHILKTQLDLGLALPAVRGLNETLEACLTGAIEISGMDAGGIYLVNASDGSVDLVVSYNLQDDFVKSVSHYPGDSLNARMVMEGKPVFTRLSKTGLVNPPVFEREGLKAIAIVPIPYNGRIIACLNISSHTAEEIPANTRVALETIATQIGVAIERIRAEEALAESEERFRLLADNLQDSIIILGFDTRVLYANNAAFHLAGIPPTLDGENLSIAPFLAPESQAKAIEDLETIRVGGGPVISEYLIRTAQGEMKWVEAVGVRIPWRGADRDLVAFRDITWRKQEEQVLQQQNRMLQTINHLAIEFASQPPGDSVTELATKTLMTFPGIVMTTFSVYDPAERTLQPTNFEIASGGAEMSGWRRGGPPAGIKIPVSDGLYQEIIHSVVGRLNTPAGTGKGQIPPFVNPQIQKQLDIDHFVGIAYVIEGELYGTSLLAIKAGQPDPSVDLLESFAHIVAVSLRRCRAEENLCESEEKLALVVNGVPALLAYVDADLRYVYVNKAYADWHGRTREEIIGKEIGELLDEHVYERSLPHYREVLKGNPVFFENPTIDGEGRERFVSTRLTPYYSGEKVTGFFAAITDFTERNRVEEALQQANKKLTHLSSITRHDINNQLAVVQGFLTILKKKQPDPSLDEYFQKLALSVQRISAMIRFTKEYEKSGIKAPVWQDVPALIDIATTQVPLGNVRVNNEVPSGAEIFADPLIVKVCYNLMDNAVRYGGNLTTIRFSVQAHGSNYLLVCEDDGEGVPADEKEQIFDRGFGKNTGLGLALSREILSITGITIAETGVPGMGARFELTVPREMWRMADRDQNVCGK